VKGGVYLFSLAYYLVNMEIISRKTGNLNMLPGKEVKCTLVEH
jgi:hypothetical protein